MQFLLKLSAMLVIIKTLYNVGRVLSVKYWRRTHGINPTLKQLPDATPDILILIPILYEQSIVDQIVNTVKVLDRSYSGKLEIILVCSGRERLTLKGDETTYNLLEKNFRMTGSEIRIKVFESSGRDRCKSDQLNEGLTFSELFKAHRTRDDLIIGIYDADSRPEETTLREVALRYIDSRETTKAFQQAPIYFYKPFKGHPNFASFMQNHILLSKVLYSYSFSFKESFGYILSGSSLDIRLSHFTGHGYFITKDLLQLAGGFTSPSCDTTLGYRISYLNHRIQLLSSFDLASVPPTLNDTFSQGIVWFNGCNLYLKELKILINANSHIISKFRTAIKVAGVFFTNLSWSSLPIVWTILGILVIYKSMNLQIWGMATGSWLLFQYYLWYDYRKTFPSYFSYYNAPLYVYLVPLFSPLSRVISCTSPLYYYYLKIFGKHVALKKTSRC